MGSLLESAWQAVSRSRVARTFVSAIPWPVRRSLADLLLWDAPLLVPVPRHLFPHATFILPWAPRRYVTIP